MANNPNFASAVRTGAATISTANAARDGTGALETVFTAGPAGSRIETVDIVAAGGTSLGMVRLYINNGNTIRLLREQPIPSVTPTASSPVFWVTLVFGDFVPLLLQSGWSLMASTNAANAFNVVAFGGDF
jgi:uncharacterized membrane protein